MPAQKQNRAIKYRAYPTSEQQVLLAKTFGCVRFIWNHMPIGGLCSECEQRLDETVYGKFNAPWQKVEQQKAERPVPWWYDI